MQAMLRKIFKSGNSLVISLPKQMLESLGISCGSDVSVALEDGKIVIRPMRQAGQAWMKTLRAV
jgi:antitoxin component of MazEF toxin-antitoxin module